MGRLNRYLDFGSRKLVRSWIRLEEPQEIPWAPLRKPLAESTVALVSTAGLALAGDIPFDQEGERRDPWWGDPSHRIIPKTATAPDVEIHHLHIDPAFAKRDINCLLPLQRLIELEEANEIGEVAESHYSLMGYLLQPQEMLEQSIPAIIQQMMDEQVDVVILIPI